MPPAYKIEVSPNRRAGCSDGWCRQDAVKIQKGEIRFATWVELPDYAIWSYKHWGCVTPKQLENLANFLDGKMALLEGFDALDDEWQAKVSRAIEEGHVDDEDWTGDPDYNRSGMWGKGPKRKKVNEEEATASGAENVKAVKDEADNDGAEAPAKKATSRKKKAIKVEDDTDANGVDRSAKIEPDATAGKAPKKQTKPRQRNAVKVEEEVPADEDEQNATTLTDNGRGDAPKKTKSRNRNPVKVEEGTLAEVDEKPARKRAKRGVAKKAALELESDQAEDAMPAAITPEDDIGEVAPPKKTRGRQKKAKEQKPDGDVHVPRKISKRAAALGQPTAAASRPKRGTLVGTA